MKIKYYLKEMRIHHYIKNLLIFVPLACSGKLFDIDKLIMLLFAFISFCFMSSAVYCINDICDREMDKQHPSKIARPIANGDITVKSACIFTVILIMLSLVFNLFCFNIYSFILLLSYLLINIGYSFGLKNIPLIDISILAAGFIIRILYGSVISDIQISNWLYLVVISVAFYLGFGKRRNELIRQEGSNTRKVIKKYPLSFLDSSMNMCMALIFVFYALWTVDEKTISVYRNTYLIWTLPLVMLIFFKYSLRVEGNSDGDPVEVLLHDKILVALCALYLIIMFVLLYVFR